MKTSKLLRVMFILLLGFILVACASSSDTPEPDNSGDEIVLELVGLEETKSFTLSDLLALPAVEGWGGTKSSAGVITVPQQLVGVDAQRRFVDGRHAAGR